MTSTTTRRAFIRTATTATAYAAGAAIVATGPAIASHKQAATATIVSPGLSKLMADTRHANARIHRYTSLFLEPAEARAARLISMVPHATAEISGKTLSTANPVHVAVARAFVGTARARQTDLFEAHNAFVNAANDREKAIQQCRVVSGDEVAGNRSNSLCDAAADAERLVFNFPVRSLADLEAKLTFIVEEQGFEVAGTAESVLADARRLAGKDV